MQMQSANDNRPVFYGKGQRGPRVNVLSSGMYHVALWSDEGEPRHTLICSSQQRALQHFHKLQAMCNRTGYSL